jgi:deoxycytidine triphosphate deaminase/predicted kinase
MRKLLVLVGVQGAGKTTVLKRFSSGAVLKPSTTRPRRSPTEDEYHFEKSWNDPDYAWKIARGQHTYGMRWSELRSIEYLGMTVFDPASLQTLKASPARTEFEIVTIGLDTVSTLAEQHARVGNDKTRSMTQTDFDLQCAVVTNCDVVLKGGEDVVVAAVEELAAILAGRGGVLSGESVERLIAAGTLLGNADITQIESASYDLRIADQYWCQGKYYTLTDAAPVATIPPYSFALVQARELARLPRFIVGTFDIRVGLFFSGVILSNGPQVDPGYSGALFCMLHNASGTEVGINRGDHFATIQFQTTAINSIGYNSKHQNKKGFTDFLDGSASKKPGGQIFEHVNSIGQKLEADFKELKTLHWTVMGVAIGALAILAAIGVWAVDKAVTAAEKAANAAESASTEMSKKAEAAQSEIAKKGEAAQKQVDEAIARLGGVAAALASDKRPDRAKP